MSRHGKDAAAKRGVARRTMRNRRLGRGETFQLSIRCVNVVREDRATASQSEAVVDGDIIRSPRKPLCHEADLVAVLIDVGLNSQSLMFLQERAAQIEHRLACRERKAG